MATRVAAASVVHLFQPSNDINTSIQQLYKQLYWEQLGRDCELILAPHQRLVFTNIPIQVASAGTECDEQYSIGQNFLPPGCRMIVSGESLTWDLCESGVVFKCSFQWKIRIECDAAQFEKQTRRSVTDLIAMIHQF